MLGACAAALVGGASAEAIADALPRFTGLPFRRSLVAETGGVRVYNDAMAATPVKAATGLGTYPRPVVWVAGGRMTFPGEVLHDSAAAHEQLRGLGAVARDHVRAAVVFGEAAPVLRHVLLEAGFAGPVEESDDLAAATRSAAAIVRPGESLVLAPVYSIPLEERARFDELALEALGR